MRQESLTLETVALLSFDSERRSKRTDSNHLRVSERKHTLSQPSVPKSTSQCLPSITTFSFTKIMPFLSSHRPSHFTPCHLDLKSLWATHSMKILTNDSGKSAKSEPPTHVDPSCISAERPRGLHPSNRARPTGPKSRRTSSSSFRKSTETVPSRIVASCKGKRYQQKYNPFQAKVLSRAYDSESTILYGCTIHP